MILSGSLRVVYTETVNKQFSRTIRNTMKPEPEHPPSFTLGEAAKRFTVSKSTLSKDRKSGKLKADKNEDGSFRVSFAELSRVYGDRLKLRTVEETVASNDTKHSETPINTIENSVLQARLELMEQRFSDAEATISDLRQRLDDAGGQIKSKDTQLTALLTDQREKAVQPAKRSWWQRLTGS